MLVLVLLALLGHVAMYMEELWILTFIQKKKRRGKGDNKSHCVF